MSNALLIIRYGRLYSHPLTKFNSKHPEEVKYATGQK
jgi:hypothetical protein